MNAPVIQNPFVGLRPYEASESLLFFGRQQQVAEILRRLHQMRFVGIVGSSGCGKSSLVRAGLIPVLRAGFLVEERDVWLVATMKPGNAPLTGLAASVLASAGARAEPSDEGVPPLVAAIRERGVEAILAVAANACRERDANLLLLVDQFEEVFRFGRADAGGGASEEFADFVSIILDLAAQREVPIYVVMTMRSDFLGDCDRFAGLPEALNRGQYLVPRLTREQRREAIEGPIRLYGRQIAARLTDRLLNETIDTRDDLPILQHALMRTWDAWQRESRGPIDVEHYEAIGTVGAALSRDADAALESMSERELLLTKRIFQALSTLDSANRGIRRPATLNDIVARCGADPVEIWSIIDRFRRDGRSFLVVSTEDVAANPMIDISHESLIRQWKRLGTWVEEEAESVRVYRRLAETARLHRAGKARLYSDPDLQVALDWQAKEAPTAAWARDAGGDFDPAMAFLRASKQARDEGLAEAEFRRRSHWIAGIVLMLVLALLVSSVLGLPPLGRFWVRFTAGLIDYANAIAAERPTFAPKARDLAVVVAIVLGIAVHAVAFFAANALARRIYRRIAFERIREEISHEARHVGGDRITFTAMIRNLRTSAPAVVERIARWGSVLAGVMLLATCSVYGVSVGGSSGAVLVLIGVLAACVLLGWVFAVARLNAEMKRIATRLDDAAVPAPVAEHAPPAPPSPR